MRNAEYECITQMGPFRLLTKYSVRSDGLFDLDEWEDEDASTTRHIPGIEKLNAKLQAAIDELIDTEVDRRTHRTHRDLVIEQVRNDYFENHLAWGSDL